MLIKYKQKCSRCRKNYVTSTRKQRYVVCHECQKKDLEGEIKDPKMKKLFKIPEEYYIKNGFLRDIKIQYLRYGSLTEKQINAFKKTVDMMRDAEKSRPQINP